MRAVRPRGLDDPFTVGGRNGLRAGVDVQLREHALEMARDRLLADHELCGDLTFLVAGFGVEFRA